MANDPAPETPRAAVRPRIQPTDAGRAQPPLAANVVSIGQEATGFTLTFYSVPADALEAPDVKAQIRAQEGKPAIDVSLTLDPSAKLFLPITTVTGLIQLLSDNLRVWNDTYARELQNFLNAKEAGK